MSTVSAALLSSVTTEPETVVVCLDGSSLFQPLKIWPATGLAVNPSGVVTDVIVDDVTVAIAGAAPNSAAHAASPVQSAAKRRTPPRLSERVLKVSPSLERDPSPSSASPTAASSE